jgi:hypothetical protein
MTFLILEMKNLHECLKALDSIKKIVLPLSPSGIKGFLEGCPIRRVIDKLFKSKLPPRVFLGAAVDNGVSHFLKTGDELGVKAAVFSTETEDFDWHDESPQSVKEQAYGLALLAISHQSLPRNIEGVQRWLEYSPAPGVLIRGKLDFIEKTQYGLIVWDMKVTTRPSKKTCGQYRTQVLVYAAALKAEGHEIAQIGLWQLNPKTREVSTPTEQVFESDLQRVGLVCETIHRVYSEGTLWVPPADGDVCNQWDCHAYRHCPFGSGDERAFLEKCESIAV